jgi:hypothetical protein
MLSLITATTAWSSINRVKVFTLDIKLNFLGVLLVVKQRNMFLCEAEVLAKLDRIAMNRVCLFEEPGIVPYALIAIRGTPAQKMAQVGPKFTIFEVSMALNKVSMGNH